MVGPASHGASGRRPAWLAWLVVLAVVVTAWLGAGWLRAADIARTYFAGAHGAGSSVSKVSVDSQSPAFPPFWTVTIGGDVTEAGRAGPSYESHMILWIEPISGVVLNGGSG